MKVTEKVYHVTSEDRVESILREGLKPTPVVWFWELEAHAVTWVALHPGKSVILEVENGKDIFKGRIVPKGVRYAKTVIAPERIRRLGGQ